MNRDFFGDYGPSKTIPRDIVDKIIEHLSIKDQKNLVLVNRFFNDAVENIDQESNPSRKIQLYRPKSEGGNYYKTLDPKNIENVKKEYLDELKEYYLVKPPNLRYLYYFEIIKRITYKENGEIKNDINMEKYILDPKTFKVDFDKNEVMEHMQFSFGYYYRKYNKMDAMIHINSSYRKSVILFYNVDILLDNIEETKEKIYKLQNFIETNKDGEYIFKVNFKNLSNGTINSNIYAVKKLSFA